MYGKVFDFFYDFSILRWLLLLEEQELLLINPIIIWESFFTDGSYFSESSQSSPFGEWQVGHARNSCGSTDNRKRPLQGSFSFGAFTPSSQISSFDDRGSISLRCIMSKFFLNSLFSALWSHFRIIVFYFSKTSEICVLSSQECVRYYLFFKISLARTCTFSIVFIFSISSTEANSISVHSSDFLKSRSLTSVL